MSIPDPGAGPVPPDSRRFRGSAPSIGGADPRNRREPVGAVGRGAGSDPVGDGGVIRRVRLRTARAAAVPAVLGILLAATGWGWPGWFTGVAGGVIGVVAVALCAAATAVLARRSRLWAAAALVADAWPPPDAEAARNPDHPNAPGASATGASALGAPPWAPAACGAPQPLYRPRGGTMWRRVRPNPAHIVAVRAVAGPLAAGEALTVHGRPDGLLPAGGDALLVCSVTPRGPFLIGRPADSALFVADRWTLTAG